MVSEFNEDVPGGFNEAQALPELLGDPGPGHRWEAGFRDRFLEAFAPYPDVALLYATAFSEDLQHCLILEKWLAEAGHGTVLGSPAHLARGWRRPRVLGVGVDAAFRYYPGEWMPKLPNFETWRRVNPGLPMMNPLRRLVRQSKLVFAIWEGGHGALRVGEGCPGPALSQDPPLRSGHGSPPPGGAGGLGAQASLRADGGLGDHGKPGDGACLARRPHRGVPAPGEWCIQERFSVLPLAFADGPLSRPSARTGERAFRRVLQPRRGTTLPHARGLPCGHSGPESLRVWGGCASASALAPGWWWGTPRPRTPGAGPNGRRS
jgi:hypothetical protein